MYFQNLTGLKTISENFVGDNADEGIQIYGSGTAALNGFVVSGNTLYNTGSWPSPNYQYNVIIAGGLTRQNIQYTNNYSYFPTNAVSGFTQFGQYTDGQDISIQNNVFAGGGEPTAVANEAGPVSFTGNILYGSPSALRVFAVALDTGQTFASYAWDKNTYYDQTPYHFNSSVSGNASNLTFANWQQSTGFDAHSTYAQTAPTGVWVYVQPNKYEGKRANITIYNWDLDATVPVNLSRAFKSRGPIPDTGRAKLLRAGRSVGYLYREPRLHQDDRLEQSYAGRLRGSRAHITTVWKLCRFARFRAVRLPLCRRQT